MPLNPPHGFHRKTKMGGPMRRTPGEQGLRGGGSQTDSTQDSAAQGKAVPKTAHYFRTKCKCWAARCNPLWWWARTQSWHFRHVVTNEQTVTARSMVQRCSSMGRGHSRIRKAGGEPGLKPGKPNYHAVR